MVVRSPRTGIRPSLVQSVLKIRNFEEKDLAEVIPLVESVFNEAYDPNLYLSLAKEWPQGVMVAEIGNKIIGFILATVQRPLQARVLILCIRPSFRSKNIGRSLMRAIMNRCIIRGLRKITLEVRISNERAHAFYAKLGFEMIGMIPKFYSNGESAFLLKKVLY